MSSRPLAAIAFVAVALLAGLPRTSHAQPAEAQPAAKPAAKPADAPAPAKPGAPAAAPAPRGSAPFSVKDGSCKDFLALAPDLRGLVIAWAAGRYHRLDRWVLDEPTARKVIAGVEQECEKTPLASFRYKVIGEVEKLRK